MSLTKTKVKNKRAFGLFAAVAIAAMFMIRYVLLSSGTIDEMYTLDEDGLYSALAAYEVTVSCSDEAGTVLASGGGTILDGRKDSVSEENYTLTIAAALVVTSAQPQAEADSSDTSDRDDPAEDDMTEDGTNDAGTSEDSTAADDLAEDDTSQDGSPVDDPAEGDPVESDTAAAEFSAAGEMFLTVTLPDGSEENASVIAWNEDGGYALIQCECPDELEVYYSRDILYRLTREDPVYIFYEDGVIGGTVTGVQTASAETGGDFIAASFAQDETTSLSGDVVGAGLYGKSGNYLGMITGVGEDGTALAVPGDIIISALNAAL